MKCIILAIACYSACQTPTCKNKPDHSFHQLMLLIRFHQFCNVHATASTWKSIGYMLLAAGLSFYIGTTFVSGEYSGVGLMARIFV